MKAIITKDISRGTKLAYSTQGVDIYYKWSPRVSWLQFLYKEEFNKKVVLNFYVVPTTDNSCVYMAYIPYLDALGEFLENEKFDWEDVFKTFPVVGKMFKGAGMKEYASSYISFLDIPHAGYKKVGMVCMKIKNHSYPQYDICLLDDKFLGALKAEEVGRKLQLLLNDIGVLYNELRDKDGFNWKKFLKNVGKVALMIALAVLLGEVIDDEGIEDIDDVEGEDSDDIDAETGEGNGSRISFGSSESVEELERELKKEEENIRYYERQQQANVDYAEYRTSSAFSNTDYELQRCLKRKEELLRKLSSLK